MKHIHHIFLVVILAMATTTIFPTTTYAVDYERNKEIAQDIYDIANYGEKRDRNVGGDILETFGEMAIFAGVVIALILVYSAFLHIKLLGKRAAEKKELEILMAAEKKEREIKKEAAQREWEETIPIIKSRYMRVINEDYKTRDSVIEELADELGISRNNIIGRLHGEGIYKTRTTAEREAEEG